MTSPLVHILVLSLCLTITQAANILDPCTSVAECPTNARCDYFGCKNQVCICDSGYRPSNDGSQCLQVQPMNATCGDPGTTCGFATCINSKCGCPFDKKEHSDGVRCVRKPLRNLHYALLNDDCDDTTTVCFDALTQICNNSKCECKEGSKASDADIFAGFPSAPECVPNDLDIGTRIDPELCIEKSSAAIIPIGAECAFDADCSGNSTCARLGCTKTCTCPSGTAANAENTNCLTVAYLDQACDPETSQCATVNTFCYDGRCICKPGYEKTNLGKCRELSDLPGAYLLATLDEYCGGITECERGLACNNTVCTCRERWRVATIEERLQLNMLDSYCIHSSIKPAFTAQEYDQLCEVQPSASTSAQATPTASQSSASMDVTSTSIAATPSSSASASMESTSSASVTPSLQETSSALSSSAISSSAPMSSASSSAPISSASSSAPMSSAPSSAPMSSASSSAPMSSASSSAPMSSASSSAPMSSASIAPMSLASSSAPMSLASSSAPMSSASSATMSLASSSAPMSLASSAPMSSASSAPMSLASSSAPMSSASSESNSITPSSTAAPSATLQVTSSSQAASSSQISSPSASSEVQAASTSTASSSSITPSKTSSSPTATVQTQALSFTPPMVVTSSSISSSPTASSSSMSSSSSQAQIQSSSTTQTMSSTTTTPATPTTLGLGEICVNDTNCPTNAACKVDALCEALRCVCNANYSADTTNKQCLTVALKIGDSCSPTIICKPPGSVCDTSGKCACSGATPSATTDGKYCVEPGMKLLGEDCTKSAECAGGPFGNCGTSGKCECDPAIARNATKEETEDEPALWPFIAQCRSVNAPTPSPSSGSSGSTNNECAVVNPGDDCKSDLQCPVNSACIEVDGTCAKRCWCNVGYAPDHPTPTGCIKVVNMSEPCKDGEQKCRGLAAYCNLIGICACRSPSYELSDDGRFCRPTGSQYFSLTLLNEDCDGITKFCALKSEQECVAGKCKCRAGYRVATERDLDAQYFHISQCRLNTKADGARLPITCTDPPVALVQDPLPDYTEEREIAKAAYAKSVVLVAVPSVLAVCLVAVVFTIIRYRRRRRLQQRLVDDVTSVSSEGSSSTRGFQIPRPALKMFRGERNWSDSNSAYQNPTFVGNSS